MGSIAGSSRFANAATLANTRGLAAQSSSLLDGFGSDLLAAGRNLFGGNGIGISNAARALNNQIVNNPEANQLLSLAVGPDATIEGMQQQIRALRATLPASKLHSSVTQVAEPTDPSAGVSESDRGQSVDTQA